MMLFSDFDTASSLFRSQGVFDIFRLFLKPYTLSVLCCVVILGIRVNTEERASRELAPLMAYEVSRIVSISDWIRARWFMAAEPWMADSSKARILCS